MATPTAADLLERALERVRAIPSSEEEDLGAVLSECFSQIIAATDGRAGGRDIGVALGSVLVICRVYMAAEAKELNAGIEEGARMGLYACMEEEGVEPS